MNALEQKKLKLKYIEKERKDLLCDISVAQSRIAELNRQRESIIMSQLVDRNACREEERR